MRFPDAFRIRLHGRCCIYCGEAANSDEHFPPASYSSRGYILPSCVECNSFAGIACPTDFEARAQFVKNKLKKKYKRHLRSPDWSNDEMSEIGFNLKTGVKVWQKQREIARDRVAWNAISYLASIDHSNDFVPIFAEVDFLEQVRKNYSHLLKK
jgi:hypothetical protein